MSDATRDQWSQWLLQRRCGGDPQQLHALLSTLAPIRDQVLGHAALRDGDRVLDVGCGDGLIAFGALERCATCQVIFSDVSPGLLQHAEQLARTMHVHERCTFLPASADDLSPLPDASVDVVTTRSVLIYVADKQRAFREFQRVLTPGGRMSIFEPINRFSSPEPPDRLWWYDVAPVAALAERVKQVFQQHQPPDSDPMLDFDERDLLRAVEAAGFAEIHLELQVTIQPHRDDVVWENWINTAWNPKIPTLAEAMQQALSPAEHAQFVAHLRPLVEGKHGTLRMAYAYLWATKAA